MFQDTKEKLKETVKDYVLTFPAEYTAFKALNREKQDNATNFAETKGTDYLVRGLFEIPETLMGMIVLKLDESELQWFKSKEGGRWFAKTFKEFRMSEKV